MIALDKDNFETEVLKADGLVLVDYWSESCVPCKALLPDIEEMAKTYKGKIKFCKLDVTTARRLAISQKVLGLPTITLYKSGEKLSELSKDDASKDSIHNMIKSALG
ncbi:thioredoxin domain-containing protein [Spirochaetota bacterium]